MSDSSRARTGAITKEGLEAKLAASLDMLEGIIASEDNPAKLAHVLGRYADTLVRAIATLYPPRQQLEPPKGPEHDWSNDRNYLEGLRLEIDHRLAQMPKELPEPGKPR